MGEFKVFFETSELKRKLYFFFFLPLKILQHLIIYGHETLKSDVIVQIRRCKSCGSAFQNFPHTDKSMESFYEKYYARDKLTNPKRTKRAVFGQYKFITPLVAGLVKNGGSVLEVGCAEGYLVHLLREQGLDAKGIEPARHKVEQGIKEYSLQGRLTAGLYGKDSCPPSSFDAILSNHVLEHLTDIHEFFRNAYSHLKPGGHLLTYTPCVEAVARSLEQGDPPESNPLGYAHAVIYSREYVAQCLAKAGFEVERSVIAFSRDESWKGERPLPEGPRPKGMFIQAAKPATAS